MTLPGMRERTMRIGSAGKTFSLTGWKVGYVTAPAALAANVAKAHQNLTFTTAPNLQRAVAVGLAKDDAYFAGLAGALQAKRDRLAAGLASLGLTVLPTQGSYFITTDFRPLRLQRRRRGVLPPHHRACRRSRRSRSRRSTTAPDAPSHYARFAFCKRDEVLDEAVARLRRHFGG